MPPEETCANCQRFIGVLEEAFVWKDNIVCRECYYRLSALEQNTPTAVAPSQTSSAVYVQQAGKTTSGLGVAALVLGILACLTCWIPLVGTLSMPLSGLGLLFGIIGVVASVIGRKSALGFPMAGVVVSLIALVLAVGSTGLFVAALHLPSEHTDTNATEETADVLEQESVVTEQPEEAYLTQSSGTEEIEGEPYDKAEAVETNVTVFPTNLDPYKQILRDQLVLTVRGLWTYCITIETAGLQVSLKKNIDPKTLKSIAENRPRFAEEATAEFDRWITNNMAKDNGGQLVESELIRRNAQAVRELIYAVSYTRRDDTPAYYIPTSGFISGQMVRIGTKNNEAILMIGQLATSTVYNTLRSTEKKRAGTILKEGVFDCLRAVYVCGQEIGVKHITVVYGYLSKDFSEKYASTDAEALGFVTSLDDCEKFLHQDLSQEEFLRRSEIFLFDKQANMKRIELTLE
ncbi:MAG: hypothetical protein GWP14_08490 [Actinobacteria bacterium]|nr:hypothetical protein [Actinomycetota bacterium]